MSNFFDNISISINDKEWTKLDYGDESRLWRNNRNTPIIIFMSDDENDVPDFKEHKHELVGFRLAPYENFVMHTGYHYWGMSMNGEGEVVIHALDMNTLNAGIAL